MERRKERKDAGTVELRHRFLIFNNRKNWDKLSELGRGMLVTRILKEMELENTEENRKVIIKKFKDDYKARRRK